MLHQKVSYFDSIAAPSPTLHRVLVEQILSADDFLIFKVGRRDFWL
jgi:hypothetical protein